ncbi:MAG: shikimate kinase, partial [Acidobacteriota bacterium]
LQGEAEFRRLESTMLSELSALGSMVVATGGGTMVASQNRRMMHERGVTIWLDVPLELLLERLESDPGNQRPLYTDAESFAALYRQRLPLYRRSDLRVEIGPETEIENAVEAVIETLTSSSCDI